METTSNPHGFSVDFLLAEITASAAESPAADVADRLMQAGQQAQRQAEQTGDFGSTLITEVQQYLTEASEDLQQFAEIVRQLGDLCVDHTIEHELSDEPEHTNSTGHTTNHSHSGGSSRAEHHTHNHAEAAKKRKTKKRQRRSFLDFYIWRLQQQKLAD